MTTVEILREHRPTQKAAAALRAMELAIRKAGDEVRCTTRYEGKSDWLVLFGVGAEPNNAARNKQLKRGRTLMLDLGYVCREHQTFRISIDFDHPQEWLDRTPNDPERWQSFGVSLNPQPHNPDGPIILVGMGRKSRAYLKAKDWEMRHYNQLRRRFPGRQIIFRPKGKDQTLIPCQRDAHTPIQDLIKGASLVYSRHSNCSVDAIIAGVPFECEDGAAYWMKDTGATPEDFLHRLAHWQYRPTEAAQAWKFAKEIVK